MDFDEARWLSEVEAAARSFGGDCTTVDVEDRLLWGSFGSGTAHVNLRGFVKQHPGRFDLRGIALSCRGFVVCPVDAVEFDEFDAGAWLTRIEALVAKNCGCCTTQDIYTSLKWGAPGSGSHGRSLRSFLIENSDRFVIDGFAVSLVGKDASPTFAINCTGVELQRSQPFQRSLMLNSAAWIREAEDHVRSCGGRVLIKDLADMLLWGSPGTGTEGTTLRHLLASDASIFHVRGQFAFIHAAGAGPGTGVPLVGDTVAFDAVEWVRRILGLLRERGGCCTTRDLYSQLHWGRPGTGTLGRSLREFLEDSEDYFRLSGYTISFGEQTLYDEEEWLQRIEAAVVKLGGECRTVEIASELLWGSPGSGTEGEDLVSMRELLKAHPDRFQLRGHCVSLRDRADFELNSRGVRARGFEGRDELDVSLWLQRAESAVYDLGGCCLVEDLSDRLLWGDRSASPGTSVISLREFLRDHSNVFSLTTTMVRAVRCRARGRGTDGAMGDGQGKIFHDDVWIQKVRAAVHGHGGKCTTQDLFLKLLWGRAGTGTQGVGLRRFLESRSQDFTLDGYWVGLTAASAALEITTAPPVFDPATSVSIVRSDLVGGVADEACVQRIDETIERFGGVCTTADIADWLLWGSPGSDTEGKGLLRDVLRVNGDRFHLEGNLVLLQRIVSGGSGTLDEQSVERVLEAIVRDFGGVCSIRDLHRRVRWGAHGSGSFGHVLREFLERNSRFQVGTQPTPSSASPRSAVSVSLSNAEELKREPLFLQRVLAVVKHCQGMCTVRDIHKTLSWGIPGSDTYGRPLREFLAGYPDLFALDGFSVRLLSSGMSAEHSAATVAEGNTGGVALVSELQRVERCLAGFGGSCRTADLAEELRWGAAAARADGISLRQFLTAHRDRFELVGSEVRFRSELANDSACAANPAEAESLHNLGGGAESLGQERHMEITA
eukprot:TRINITY_DN55452_c0_g1_i1.p1 TRINITY_DN55452_c0_g1~~TRINITY_DN55452_c0_g1_i1.p1  ORF type:complete len:945 (+),score=141.21 TRINITY_DN55452_c0_g1_i1:92-2926(+)